MTRYTPTFPKNILTIPKGTIAIHNIVNHHVGQRSGENGFRVWFDEPHENYVECSCGWRPDLGIHYQVRTHYKRPKPEGDWPAYCCRVR
jgi:hypothetical protein